MSCAICEIRKEKRFCPAMHDRICPQCCGEQREVTLDCPSECVYLQQARLYEKPRPAGVLDQAALFPRVEIEQKFIYENEHLLLGISFALAKSARAERSVHDTELLGALSSMASSYETLVNSGLHFEMPVASVVQQAVTAEVQNMIKQYRDTEHQHLGYNRLRDVDLLRALVFLLRMGFARTSGRPKSRAFADFLTGQFPEQDANLSSAGTGSIILP